MTADEICIAALQEINVNDPVDTPAQADLFFVLAKLNRLLDNWNADRQAVYANQFLEFTITPSLNPHTIGIAANTPTWTVVGNRPVSIEGAILILAGSNPQARIPMRKRDAQWFQNLITPGIEVETPTDWYYDATWPNGSFYLWPVPSQANTIQLWVRSVLSQLTQFQTFDLPPGYQDAIILTLAEDIGPTYEKPPSMVLMAKAKAARARIFGNNIEIPTLSTRDAGMPSGGGQGLPDFLWTTGQIV